MNIFAPPKPRAKSGPTAAPASPPRVPSFEEVRLTTQKQPGRETTRTGPAAGFDFGFTLPEMTMAEIAAMPPAEWETTRRPIAAIQAELGPDPLSAEPIPLTDWADALHGIEVHIMRRYSQATDATTRLLNRHLSEMRLPAIAASQDLETAIDMASMEADGILAVYDAERAQAEADMAEPPAMLADETTPAVTR